MCSLIFDLHCLHFHSRLELKSSSPNGSVFLANEKLQFIYTVVKELKYIERGKTFLGVGLLLNKVRYPFRIFFFVVSGLSK